MTVAIMGWCNPVHGRNGAALIFGLNLLVLIGFGRVVRKTKD